MLLGNKTLEQKLLMLRRSDTFFAFPPFSLLGRVVQKIEDDRPEGIRDSANEELSIQFRLV